MKKRYIQFSSKWSSSAGLHADIDLFKPQNRADQKEAKVQVKQSELNYTIEKKDLEQSVALAYIEAIISQEQVRLCIADTLSRSRILKVYSDRYSEGRATKIEVNNAKTDLNKSINQYTEAINILNNAKAELLYWMGYSPKSNSEIQLDETIEELYAYYEKKSLPKESESLFLKEFNLTKNLYETKQNGLKQLYLPTLSIKSYLGTSFYNDEFNVFEPNNWYGNSYVALSLEVPIYNHQERKQTFKKYDLELQKEHFLYQDKINKNALEQQKAERAMEVYRSNYLLSKDNLKIFEENLKLKEKMFSEGRITVDELYEEHYQYEKERNNYLQNAYNHLVAKINWERIQAN